MLLLVNLAAVLGLAGTAYGFLNHRSEMGQAFRRPDFVPSSGPLGSRDVSKIDSVSMPLGRFPKTPDASEAPKVEEPAERVEDVLGKYGTILSGFAFPGPYEEGGLQPSITFRLKNGNTVTIRRGDALETRPNPNPKYKRFPVPYRYQFIGCEPDPEHDGAFFFLFDMKCDGTDIQKARWRGDAGAAPETPEDTPIQVSTSDIYFGEEPGEAVEAPKEEPKAEERPAETVAVQPPPPPVVPTPAPTEGFDRELFEDDEGRLAATQEAVDYLRENYQDILKDARTKTYVDPATKRQRGIQVLSIERNSVANRFGIRPDDVILSINGRPVTRQAQAVNIVKEELKANKNVIEVKILRNGETISKQYDTRDPATRRAARDAFRNRR
jgi:hypothetical protein